MSDSDLPTFTDEEVDAMSRGDLQKHLKKRNESAGGTNEQLADRLKAWRAARSSDEEEEEVETDGESDDNDGADSDGSGETPQDDTQSENPPADETTPAVAPSKDPAPNPTNPLTPSSEESDEEAEVTVRRGGPRKSSFGKVLSRGAPEAEAFADLCKEHTLVRLHSTPVVQKIAVPFGLGGKARAVALFGIDLKSYINEELGLED